MNLLTLIAILILLIGMMMGYKRGLIRAGFRLLATILSLLLSYFFAPLVADLIVDHTKVDDAIEHAIYSKIEEQARQKVKQQLGVAMGDMGIQVTDEMVQAAMEVELNKNEQIEMLNEIEMSDSVRDALIENNHNDAKEQLGVSGFYRYISTYLTRMIVRTMAYILTFIVVGLLLLIVDVLIKFALKLPVLGTLNRLAGLLLGLGQALLIIWLGMIIISLISGSDFGMGLYKQINESPMLMYFQNHNILKPLIGQLTKVIF